MLKADVDDMMDWEARDIWVRLEPFFSEVCAQASSRRRDATWLGAGEEDAGRQAESGGQ